MAYSHSGYEPCAELGAGPVLPKRRTADVSSAQLSLADYVATFELNRLPVEVARYLAAVDTFELEGCAPTWRLETAADRG